MDEQTASPGATAENNNQRNGDEVRARHLSNALLMNIISSLLSEPSKWFYLVFFFFVWFVCFFVETSTWQLDQREEEEEANERQQCTQSPPHWLRSFHEWQAGAAPGRASGRALPRDHQDVGQRVEQTAPRGEAGERRLSRQDYIVSSLRVNCKTPKIICTF